MDNATENANLANFKKMQDGMVAKNREAYSNRTGTFVNYIRKTQKYTRKEIEDIIDNGTEIKKRELSRTYFGTDGFYRRILIYYATLLKYSGLLIPNMNTQADAAALEKANKRYYGALDFIEQAELPTKFANFTLRALVDGAYYGAIVTLDKTHFTILDLPADYCRTRFKDLYGNDIVEFNLDYFSKITDEDARRSALASYPEIISKAFKKYNKGKRSAWLILPSEIGICFTPFDEVSPLFLSTIIASMDYDDAITTDKAREKEEIKKIIVQKIPHNNENNLLFEPDEALEIHRGTVEMMRNNENVSVLTTYADVDAITSRTSSESVANSVEKMVNNIYSEAGTTGQLFGSNSNMSINYSINNDMAMMMTLFANKYSAFTSRIVNSLFGNGNISFKYSILPITYYNSDEYIDSSYKLATAGYSFLLPAIGMGLSQRDLTSIKDLENNLLKLDEKLKPLNLAYTQGGQDGEGGRPTVKTEDKNPSTIAKEESMDGQGGNN